MNGSTRFVPSPACDYQPDDPLIIPAVRQQRRLSELRELASAGDPRAPAANGAAVDEVLATLIDGRVIVTRTTAARGEPVAELVHDALIRDWPQLRKWVEQDHHFQQWLYRVEAKYKLWTIRHDHEELLRGSDLSDGLSWAVDRRLPRVTADFLDASKRADSRAAWIRRAFFAGLIVLALAASGTAAVATRYAAQANNQHIIALSRQRAAQSQNIERTEPITARRLATAAWQLAPTVEASNAITKLLTQQQSVLVGHTEAYSRPG